MGEFYRSSLITGEKFGRYPEPDSIAKVLRDGSDEERLFIARQWLSEGVPFVFRECPEIYETVRSWLGRRLNVATRGITLVGSSRFGWSLSPDRFGESFGPRSDLDLIAVSEDLFESMKGSFLKWLSDFREGRIQPSKRQKRFWRDNRMRGPGTIERGFLDSKMIPTIGDYDTKEINNVMWELKEYLNENEDAPNVRKASLRCYRSWSHFERQMLLNLKI